MHQLRTLLDHYNEPLFGIHAKHYLKNVQILEEDGVVQIHLRIGFFLSDTQIDQLISKLSDYLYDKGVEQAFEIDVASKVETHKVQSGLKPIKGIKNIIAIASGKGGVGKSTTCSNLAIALANNGAKVGILDADIYGPSQPLIMGSYDNPTTDDKKKIKPLVRHGVKVISVGNLIDPDSAIIWRGPMVSGALMQLLNDTDWGELDYLFIDLPPGTGDIQLTMAKKIPMSASIIVTTPQDLSLIDAKRAIAMFNKVQIHTLGIIENMSVYTCQNCGETAHIFGEKAAEKLVEKYDTSLLGSLPLAIEIREDADSGNPTMAKTQKNALSQLYDEIALQVSAKIASLPKALMINMPTVKVEYTNNSNEN